MVFDGFAGVNCASDDLGPVSVVDYHKEVQRCVVLIAHERNVIDDNVPKPNGLLALARRHEEHPAKPIGIFIDLDMHSPPIVFLLFIHQHRNHRHHVTADVVNTLAGDTLLRVDHVRHLSQCETVLRELRVQDGLNTTSVEVGDRCQLLDQVLLLLRGLSVLWQLVTEVRLVVVSKLDLGEAITPVSVKRDIHTSWAIGADGF